MDVTRARMQTSTPLTSMTSIVNVPQPLLDSLKTRFRNKGSGNGYAAIVVRVNKETNQMEEETKEGYDTSIDDLAEALPEHNPRYIVLSYALSHSDGRISYPRVLISWVPTSADIHHADGLLALQKVSNPNKVIEIRENTELLTKEYLDQQLLSKF